jgi:hypothetical protein
MRGCLVVTILKLITVLGVVVTINKVVLPRINKATYVKFWSRRIDLIIFDGADEYKWVIIKILPCDYNYLH